MQLELQATWKVGSPADLLLAQQRAMTLISMFDECTGALPIACGNDFRGVDAHGWVNQPNTPGTGQTMGQFVPFIGWDATSQFDSANNQTLAACYIYKDFSPAIALTSAEIVYDLTKGAGTVAAIHGVFAFNGGSLVGSAYQDWRSFPDGTAQTYGFSGSAVTCTRIYVQMVCDQLAGNVSAGGTFRLRDFNWGMEGGDCS